MNPPLPRPAKVFVLAGFAPSLLNFRRELLVGMVRAGHEVVAGAPDFTPTVEAGLREIGVTCRSVPLRRTGMNPVEDLRLWRALKQLFRSESPDVLLSYTIKPVVFGSLAAQSAGVPRIHSLITGLGYAFLGETWKQRLIGGVARMLYRAALRHNGRVFFQNPDDRALFSQLGLLASESQAVVVHGSGVDLVRFAQVPAPVDPMRFLLVARLYREKGIREFVGAARIVRQRYPQARFHLVGAADSNPSALGEAELTGWEREGIIERTGWVEDVRPHFRTASVYVLPSYREGTPRTVLEAMAMGRAIITTDAPGCRETVEDGYNGFLVPPKQVGPLADAMGRFLADPSLVGSMGNNSRELAERKFDAEAVAAVMLREMGLDG